MAGPVQLPGNGQYGGGVAAGGGDAQHRFGPLCVAFLVKALGQELHRVGVARLGGAAQPLFCFLGMTGFVEPNRQELHRGALASFGCGSC